MVNFICIIMNDIGFCVILFMRRMYSFWELSTYEMSNFMILLIVCKGGYRIKVLKKLHCLVMEKGALRISSATRKRCLQFEMSGTYDGKGSSNSRCHGIWFYLRKKKVHGVYFDDIIIYRYFVNMVVHFGLFNFQKDGK